MKLPISSSDKKMPERGISFISSESSLKYSNFRNVIQLGKGDRHFNVAACCHDSGSKLIPK